MPKEDTKKRILDYISAFSDVHGFAPTYREIGKAVGLRSSSTVFEYIKELKEEGKLNITEGRPRALALYRRIPMKVDETQRLRVELADGGFFYVDCSLKNSGSNQSTVVLSGIMDASHLRSNVGSIIGCTVDNG